MNRFVAVAGNIGVGKTSLVEFLHHRYQLKPFFEPHAQNPYLNDFYKDMRRWAFRSQIYFLTHKFRMHRKMEQVPGSVIQDRTIYEDAEIFAHNLHMSRAINQRDWKTYWDLYETLRNELTPPDLMIFLRCSTKTMRKRIKMRGRKMEASISTSYLRRLEALYQDWISRYHLSDVIQIDSDNIDYVTDLVHQIDLLQQIEKKLDKIR